MVVASRLPGHNAAPPVRGEIVLLGRFWLNRGGVLARPWNTRKLEDPACPALEHNAVTSYTRKLDRLNGHF